MTCIFCACVTFSFRRATGNALVPVHGAAAAHRAQLRGEQAPLPRLQLREALPRRALPLWQQRAQQAEGVPGARPALQDARHRPAEQNIRGWRPAPPVHQCVVWRAGGERGKWVARRPQVHKRYSGMFNCSSNNFNANVSLFTNKINAVPPTRCRARATTICFMNLAPVCRKEPL